MILKLFKMDNMEILRQTEKQKKDNSIRNGTQVSLKCKENTVFDLQVSAMPATLKCFFNPRNSSQSWY